LTRHPPLPFANVKFTKLTSNGTAETAVISPDGKVVVYAAKDAEGMALWRRNSESGQISKLVDRVTGTLHDLGFTDHGATVQWVTSPINNPARRNLFLTPLAGGTITEMSRSFPGPVTISMDGRWAAFYNSNQDQGTDELFIMELLTGKKRLLASYKYPRRFAWTCKQAWSSDTKKIAYATEDHDEKGFLVRLYEADVATGARHEIISPRWQWVQSIQWTNKDSALAVVGQEHEASFQQIWFLPYPGSRGAARRIGNDLDDYIGASLTADGTKIVSVQSQTLSNVYVAKPEDLAHPVQLTPGTGRYFDLSWLPDGRIVYASDATGSADLWLMNANGSGQRQITSGIGRSYGPTASPDAKSIAYHSNRTGNWEVWRIDMNGTGTQQLSSNAGDGNWPQFTPDGKNVVFHRTSPTAVFNLWQVPSHGGTAKQLTTAVTMHPAVSRADGRIAAWYSDKAERPEWKLAIFAPDGGAPLRVLSPTANSRPDTPIRWMPKGDAISFLDYGHPGVNIWALPLDGRPARPLTSFASGDIFSFDWSRDGRLVFSRGLTTADVVLIRDMTSRKRSE
jgi:TolB protein